jgi:hypothetical protein
VHGKFVHHATIRGRAGEPTVITVVEVLERAFGWPGLGARERLARARNT